MNKRTANATDSQLKKAEIHLRDDLLVGQVITTTQLQVSWCGQEKTYKDKTGHLTCSTTPTSFSEPTFQNMMEPSEPPLAKTFS